MSVMKNMVRVGVVFFCMLLAFPEVSGQGIVLDESEREYRIDQKIMKVVEDSGCGWSINQVASPSSASKFHYFSVDDPIINSPNTCYWIRFSVRNHSKAHNHWLLEFQDFRIDDIELFQGTQRIGASGEARVFNSRSYDHKNFVYNLRMVPGEEQVFYARIKSNDPVYAYALIRTAEKFSSYALGEYFALALFYGVIFTLLIYNLLIYFSIRDSSYLYYLLYLLSVTFLATSRDGFGFQYLWPWHPEFNKYLFPVSELCMVVLTCLYARKFLKLRLLNPPFAKLITILIIARIALFFYAFFFSTWMLYEQWLDLLVLFPLFVVGIISVISGYKPARYYVVAFAFLFMGFIVTLLFHFKMVPVTFMTFYSVNVGVIGQVIFLSMALADKLRAIVSENEKAQDEVIYQLKENEKLKEKVNRELEQKVRERTKALNLKTEELSEANVKLQELTGRLNEMNVKLDMDNWKLSQEVKEKTKAIIVAEELPYPEFCKVFPDELACMRYLEELKWGAGYSCKKCGNGNYSETDKKFSRKCTKCDNIESVTAYTLFHAIKFPLTKAFYILYSTVMAKNKITLSKLSDTLDLRLNTCSDFRKKVQERKISVQQKTGKDQIEKWEKLIFDF
ncbi:MAG: 7TM diverse intracellular signaling domain-containing protein [Cytophagaceae bacterium]